MNARGLPSSAHPLAAASRTPKLIDRDAVWAAKREALEVLRKVPLADGRQASLGAVPPAARPGARGLGRLVRAGRGARP